MEKDIAPDISNLPPIDELDCRTEIPQADEIQFRFRPIVLRGLVADWPLVDAGTSGPALVSEYLARFDAGVPLRIMCGDPRIAGRFFYRDDMQGFNFGIEEAPLGALLSKLAAFSAHEDPPTLYAGSTPAEGFVPGLERDNPMPLPTPGGRARIWIGNATRVAPHFDMSDNIAVVAVGRRRFTLFPPEQTPNLYVGPLETTLAGQPVSMVDPDCADAERHPRFAEALRHASTSELLPGDAIYIPKMWWHGVTAEGSLNILVNYWYHEAENGSPFAALVHSIMAIREMTPPERRAMRSWFDHFVFDDDAARAADHLPAKARGVLGKPTNQRNAKIAEYLRRTLDRGGRTGV
jgi:hypothetical protein